jgi:hypothetical protein
MAIHDQKRAVGIFTTRREAKQALHELKSSGFPMAKVSVIAQDINGRQEMAGAEVYDQVGNKADSGAATGAVTGGALGGLTGLLVGLGTLAIPGVGPIVLAGEVATALATAVAGGAIGAAAGGLVGGLVGLGIPEERARVYNDRIAKGEYLVIVDGSDGEVAIAQAILADRGIQEWGVYDVPVAASSNRAVANSYASAPMAATNPLDRTAGSTSDHQRRAIGVFPSRGTAEAALDQLRNAGFSMRKVSVVAKDADQSETMAGAEVTNRVGNKSDEGAATGAVTGGAVGGLGGLLVGLGALAIPGIGPIMLAGATATALATTFSGAAIGAAAGGLIGALVGLGIPEERARHYNDRISQGDYLVIVDGTEADLREAEAVLSHRGIQDWGIYNIPAPDQSPTRVGDRM